MIGGPGLNGGQAVASGQTSEIASPWRPIPTMTRVGIQLISEGDRRVFSANGTTDAVVGGSTTWTIAGGAFVAGDVGGFLVVRGTVSNDGIYTISSRTSSTVIVTSGAAATDETFTAAATFSVIPPGAVAGTWMIRVSNDYNDGRAIGELGAVGRETVMTDTLAHITDITSQFSPSIAAVVAATASTRNQYVVMTPPGARMLQVAFLPVSTGAGRIYAIVSGVS